MTRQKNRHNKTTKNRAIKHIKVLSTVRFCAPLPYAAAARQAPQGEKWAELTLRRAEEKRPCKCQMCWKTLDIPQLLLLLLSLLLLLCFVSTQTHTHTPQALKRIVLSVFIESARIQFILCFKTIMGVVIEVVRLKVCKCSNNCVQWKYLCC